MISHYLVALAAVVLTALSQVLLKVGARAVPTAGWRVWCNPYTLTAYGTLVFVTLMNLYAFKVVPMKFGLVVLPLTLMLVLILSVLLLGERLTRQAVFGVAVTVTGVVVFNL